MIDDDRHADVPGTSSPLSPEGRSRREAMRSELLGTLRRHHRRRRVLRQGAAAAVLVLASAAAGLVMRAAPTPALRADRGRDAVPIETPDEPEPSRPETMDPAPTWRIARVSTDPGTRARLAAALAPRVQVLTDDGLVQALAEAGRPGAIVRRDGEAWMLWRDEAL